MAINLEKGHKIDLEKQAPGITKFTIGCGWDATTSNGRDFDLDASVIMLNESGKMRSDADLIYFGRLKSACGAVIHTGDNLTGKGDGDDEQIKIDTDKIPADVKEVIVVVNIYQARDRNQNFGQVKNAFIRLFDTNNATVTILNYDLGEDFSSEISVTFGRIYRHNGVWKFEAVGTGVNGGLQEYLNMYKA